MKAQALVVVIAFLLLTALASEGDGLPRLAAKRQLKEKV